MSDKLGRIPVLWLAWSSWNRLRQRYEEDEARFELSPSLIIKCKKAEAALEAALDKYIQEALEKRDD